MILRNFASSLLCIAFASLVLLIQLPNVAQPSILSSLFGGKQAKLQSPSADHQPQLRRWGYSMPICSTKMQAWQKNRTKCKGFCILMCMVYPWKLQCPFFRLCLLLPKLLHIPLPVDSEFLERGWPVWSSNVFFCQVSHRYAQTCKTVPETYNMQHFCCMQCTSIKI